MKKQKVKVKDSKEGVIASVKVDETLYSWEGEDGQEAILGLRDHLQESGVSADNINWDNWFGLGDRAS